MKSAPLFAVPILVLIVLAGAGLSTRGGAAEPEASPSPSPSPSASPEPSATPEPTPDYSIPSPSPMPAATPAPDHSGALKPGDWVQVTDTGDCLNVRTQPSLAAPYPGADANSTIFNCLPDGFIARLDERSGITAPVQADGHWWWYLLGQGWAAEDWLTFHHEGGAFYPARPELASQGLVAFLGPDRNLWLMNPDGSGQRQIAARSSDNENFDAVRWSPNGHLLSFTVRRYDQAGGSESTRLVNTDGAVIADMPGLAEAVWSPDSSRLSAIRYERLGDMGGYYGRPVVLNLANGVETVVGPAQFYMTAPAWSPDGFALAYVCTSAAWQETQPDGTQKEMRIDCRGDGLSVTSADGSGAHVVLPFSSESTQSYTGPSWSPDGRTIALSTSGRDDSGCRGYVLVDVASGIAGSCIPLPPWGGAGGGCGGSSEMNSTDWSPDGRLLAFHSMYGAGTNGVYLYDTVVGSSRVIPSNNASHVSFSTDGLHLAFGAAGYIWVIDTDGSGLAVVAEGSSPAWQP